ncbi:MAG: transpeptidase family protein [Treponema sp.]|nr:transpeptidase family protein [Candidatus Treponema caballi]
MAVNRLFSRGRFIVLCVLLGLAAVWVLYNYLELALEPISSTTTQVTKSQRGSIFDKNGKLLAVQSNFYHLSATPSTIRQSGAGAIEKTAEVLAPLLDMDELTIYSTIANARTDFVYIKKKLDETTHDNITAAIAKNGLKGLRFDTVAGRVYPENALASQLIGFMGDDGNGLSGIEYTYQDNLTPKTALLDTASSQIDTRGQNVYLTIDANLQYKLEKISAEAMESTGAESMMLLAADARTGNILSYISLPAADLNTYTTSTEAERIDRPAMYQYEPGSVFKVFSVASFIEKGCIKEDELFYCGGKTEITGPHGEKAYISCLDHHGWITAREALQYSCNCALAEMSMKCNETAFLEQLKKFGFGSKTGLEVPSEARGSIREPDNPYWSIRSKPTISIGQEMSVTALQMVQAMTAIANGGVPVKLSLVSKIVGFDGSVEYEHETEYLDRVVSKKTADYLLSCMETTAQYGTGTRANVGGVSIGVKTGTAQMLDPETKAYSETDFVSNCMAVFPVEKPEIILYIVITKAQGETYAGRIVAPVISQAADVIIDHLGMARSNAASLIHPASVSFYTGEASEINDTVPDFSGTPKRMLTSLLGRNDLKVLITGDGYVVSQTPEPGTPVTENMTIELFLE